MSSQFDPRRGAPSCSALERLEKCPGSWLAQQGLPDEASDDAASGTRIHKALETGDFSALSADEMDTAEMCSSQAQEVAIAWGGEDCLAELCHEIRLGLTRMGGVVLMQDDQPCPPLLISGQADLVLDSGDAGLVIDYKTGRGEVESAERNAQLRGLAVLAAKYWGLASVRVAIVQPWAGKPSVADYDAEALAAAEGWLRGVLASVARAVPESSDFENGFNGLWSGPWCRYCKAKASCPALRETALQPARAMSAALPTEPKEAREELFRRAFRLPPDELAHLVSILPIVEWFAAGVEGAAKKRLADGETIPGYRLKPGVVREKITDAQLVYERLSSEHGITANQFTEICTVTKTDVKALVRARSPELKGKALEAALDAIYTGAVTATKTAMQLEEVKP